jgi:hypothetical protein
MKHQLRVPFANLQFENWQNLVLFVVFLFYLSQVGFWVVKDRFLRGYGWDYLAFWSAGKIYSIENLRTAQTQELETQGLLEKGEGTTINPFPAPYFSFFVIPFQFLSRVNPKLSYWLWTSINLSVLIGYLFFYLHKTQPENSPLSSNKRILLLMLLSFPVVINLAEGQLEVFLFVCTGEFIRYALNKKSLPSGLWLGGLLLKPQLLIIIIPVLLIQKNWKVLLGFFASSGLIIGFSLILSGFKGMRSLISLWTQFGTGVNAASATERMINWRMIAANLNSPIGWVIAILGMALTLIAVYFLVKNKYAFGSSRWVMVMLGVFSATLAVTWHSHFHMAMVLIPFLIYCSYSMMLNEKVVFLWAVTTPLFIIAINIILIFVFYFSKINIIDMGSLFTGIIGFILNLVILISALRFFYRKNETPNLLDLGNPTA